MSLFSENLKWVRENCGFTQQQLANACNLDRSSFSYYESGKVEPSLQALARICLILGVTIDDMLRIDLKNSVMHKARIKKLITTQKDETQLLVYYRAMSMKLRRKSLNDMRKLALSDNPLEARNQKG